MSFMKMLNKRGPIIDPCGTRSSILIFKHKICLKSQLLTSFLLDII